MHPALTYSAADVRPRPGGGRLSGWVIPAKDTADVAGWPTTSGSPLRSRVAGETTPFLAGLQRHGALIDAKTLTSELGATIYAERPDVPLLSSPAYAGCTPGGSSTGAAVVVADGLYRAAHGGDAGGSLRVPAAACEVVGFKPGAPQQTVSVDGFITRTVADQVELWGLPRRRLEALSVGVLTAPLFTPGAVVDAGREGVVRRAAALLAGYFPVREVAPLSFGVETYRHFSARIKHSFVEVDPLDSPYIAWLRDEARSLTPSTLSAAAAHIAALPSLVRTEWDVDIVLTPMIATDPPPLGFFPSLSPADSFEAQTEWSPWGSLFNLTGAPAAAVGPVQVGGISPAADDAAVLEIARLIEPVVEEWQRERRR